MGSRHRVRGSRTTRLIWGGVAVLLVVALVWSVRLSKSAVRDAEVDAEARAVDWVSTVLSEAAAPEQLLAPISGSEFEELLMSVQAGILADERAVRVRLWNSEGTLVFSSDQRDKIGRAQAADDPEITEALDGRTASVHAKPLAAPRSGLAGADEELFQTFVPMPVGGQVAAGVAEIGQRYGAIEAEGQDTLRIAQIGLGLLLLGSVVLLLRPRRHAEAPTMDAPSATEAPEREDASPASRREEATAPSRREVKAAESAAVKAQQQVREALERAERAEAAVAESEAAVAESRLRVAELEGHLTHAQERVAAAESVAREAAQLAAGERGLRGVPRVGALVAGTSVVAAEGTDGRLREAELEHDRLSDEVERLRAALAERDAELSLAREGLAEADGNGDVRTRLAEEEARAKSAEERVEELEEQLRELRSTIASSEAAASEEALDRAGDTVEAGVSRKLAETESALEQAKTELAAAEEARTKLAETESALEQAKAELAAAREAKDASYDESTPPVGEMGDLPARIEQLEADRRAGVAELQRAQEALANTQFEATSARNRVKELEEQLRRATEEAAVPAPDGEEPPLAPSPADSAEQPAEPPRAEPRLEPPRPERQPEVSPAAEEAPPEDALSLRERLIRAAAARHRPPGATPPDEA